MRWYLSKLGNVEGSFEAEEIREGIAKGTIKAGLSVRDEASSAWTPIENSPFAPLFSGKAKPSHWPGLMLLLLVGSMFFWLNQKCERTLLLRTLRVKRTRPRV